MFIEVSVFIRDNIEGRTFLFTNKKIVMTYYHVISFEKKSIDNNI